MGEQEQLWVAVVTRVQEPTSCHRDSIDDVAVVGKVKWEWAEL